MDLRRSGMSLTWGAFPFCQTNQVETKWNYQQKMEQHLSVETNFPIELNDPFTFRPKFLPLLSKVGLETIISGNETASFGRSRPTGQRHMTCESSQLECPEMRSWEEDRNAPIRDRQFEAHVS